MNYSQSVQQLVIISGMGGSGKTQALHTLEDIGFYCMDNIPIIFLPQLLESLLDQEEVNRLAVSVDVRDKLFFAKVPAVIENLLENGTHLEMIFLDASNDVLLQRYKETRRVHTLDKNGNLEDAINEERKRLSTIIQYANHIVDTSDMTVHELRNYIQNCYTSLQHNMDISLVSFGYKHGPVRDADIVLDVRFLKNPYFVPELKNKTGKDLDVRQYVASDSDFSTLIEKVLDIVHFLLPRYQKEGKRYLTIAIGCTGGRHRSVAVVETLASQIQWKQGLVRVIHRDWTKI